MVAGLWLRALELSHVIAVAAFVAEFAIKFLAGALGEGPNYFLKSVESGEDGSGDKSFEEESSKLRTSALTVTGLVFTGFATLLTTQEVTASGDPPALIPLTVMALSTSIGFLMIATFSHELTKTRRFGLTLQEMALEYGLILVLIALLALIVEYIPAAEGVMVGALVVVLAYRYVTVYDDVRSYYKPESTEAR